MMIPPFLPPCYVTINTGPVGLMNKSEHHFQASPNCEYPPVMSLFRRSCLLKSTPSVPDNRVPPRRKHRCRYGSTTRKICESRERSSYVSLLPPPSKRKNTEHGLACAAERRLSRGFADAEFMNVVLDDAAEVYVKSAKPRRPLGE
jgi:hypothetical protein